MRNDLKRSKGHIHCEERIFVNIFFQDMWLVVHQIISNYIKLHVFTGASGIMIYSATCIVGNNEKSPKVVVT